VQEEELVVVTTAGFLRRIVVYMLDLDTVDIDDVNEFGRLKFDIDIDIDIGIGIDNDNDNDEIKAVTGTSATVTCT